MVRIRIGAIEADVFRDEQPPRGTPARGIPTWPWDPYGFLGFRYYPAPAAGARFNGTVPPGVVWRIHSIRCDFAAAVAAGNRHPDAGLSESFITEAFANSAIDKPFTSGESGEIFFNRGQGHQTIPTSTYLQRVGAFPDTIALPGMLFYIGCDAMNALDQVSAVMVYREEWALP